ncbi:MAG TPA: ATPase [Citricoccus sp.]
MRQVSVVTTIMPGHDHVSGLERLRGPVTVVRRCESLAELISVARSGVADALLVAGDTEHVTLTFLDAVAAGTGGTRPVAVVALTDVSSERERLRGLGVTAVTPETEAMDLAALLQDEARQARDPAPAGRARWSTTGHDDSGPEGGVMEPAGPVEVTSGRGAPAGPARRDAPEEPTAGPRSAVSRGGHVEGPGTVRTSAAQSPAITEEDRPVAPAGPGRMTAVWGPAGSPGRTTVAVNLAVELTLAGRRTLLIDLDTYAAAAGVHLGLLDESAGIAQACRLAETGRISPDGLARAAIRARVAGGTLQVLTGLTRSDRWPELRTAALDAVLDTAAQGWEEVVVDCGFSLEQDEELSFDIPAPQRNAATLAALARADRVLAVGTGDPVGLPRLVRALEDLDQAVPSAVGAVEVVINQVRADASGVAPASQVRGVFERFAADRSVGAFLPWDRKALDRALLGGQVLAEAAPQSALRRALAGLAGVEMATARTARLPRLPRWGAVWFGRTRGKATGAAR